MIARCLLLILVAALAACSAPRATYFGRDLSPLYRQLEIGAAGTQGPVPLLLRGNPFGGSAAALAEAARAGMSASAAIYPIRLTLSDPGPRSVDYRIIVAFGQPGLGANGLCAAPDAPFGPEPMVNATAAFCIGERLVSAARGRSLDPIAVPEDPAFAAFMKGLAEALFPPAMQRRSGCSALVPC
ncbi:MAG: hypothetical protein FJX57_01495 [Alphaproteobacteria bacterium]|nr:hypothetical protein [Alphaproteobacteria bacterium]